MTFRLKNSPSSTIISAHADLVALSLRVGLGSVFVIGGWWKLSRAIDPERSGSLVQKYFASDGYINAFFTQYLFEGPLGEVFSPLMFLTALSTFELVAGTALIAGLFVRPLSFIYAFLLWAFVIALPVSTVSVAVGDVDTHLSPALLVQARDIGLSAMFFALFSLGSGRWSLDRRFFRRGYLKKDPVSWDAKGLLLRLGVAFVFLTGGLFAGYGHIKTYVDMPLLLLALGIFLISGHFVRLAAAGTGVIVLWFIVTHIDFDVSFWNNLNGVKREIAYVAAAGVLLVVGGGTSFRPGALLSSPMSSLVGGRRPKP